jgi:hypothetical protein
LLREKEKVTDRSIPLLSTVALVIDLPGEHLTRGQIGTVVEHLGSNSEIAELVEFADENGRTYAMLPVKPEQLLVLHRQHQAA